MNHKASSGGSSAGANHVEHGEGRKTLAHPDGTRRMFVEEGADGRGEYLVVRSVVPPTEALPGPHRHPVVEQTFTVEEGAARFRVDGREAVLGPGESVTVRPGEVHEFENVGGGWLAIVEVDRPPGRHREMFEFMYRLDVAGKLNARGIPKDPLLLGMLWERMDGYIAGPPAFLQRLVFGGLARLARMLGYEDGRGSKR